MKTIIYLCVSLLISQVVQTQKLDMQQYLKETRQIIADKKYPEALERCIWFHEHALEHQPSMVGVRLSFALQDWKRLGGVYPPAKQAMIDIRDKTVQRLRDGSQGRLFQDLVALNRTLGESEKSIMFFDHAAKDDPQKAKSYWYYIKDALFEEKRYDLIKPFMKSAAMEFEQLRHLYVLNREIASSKKMPGNFSSMFEKKFIDDSLRLIEFYLALNDLTSAKLVQKEALHLIKDEKLLASIPAGKQ